MVICCREHKLIVLQSSLLLKPAFIENVPDKNKFKLFPKNIWILKLKFYYFWIHWGSVTHKIYLKNNVKNWERIWKFKCSQEGIWIHVYQAYFQEELPLEAAAASGGG